MKTKTRIQITCARIIRGSKIELPKAQPAQYMQRNPKYTCKVPFEGNARRMGHRPLKTYKNYLSLSNYAKPTKTK